MFISISLLLCLIFYITLPVHGSNTSPEEEDLGSSSENDGSHGLLDEYRTLVKPFDLPIDSSSFSIKADGLPFFAPIAFDNDDYDDDNDDGENDDNDDDDDDNDVENGDYHTHDQNAQNQEYLMIESVGPVFTVASHYQVVPVWVRTGKLILYFRLLENDCWRPILQYGSTADHMPVYCEPGLISPAFVKYPMADSIVYERVFVELLLMESTTGFPATCRVSSWPVFFHLFNWKALPEKYVIEDVQVQILFSNIFNFAAYKTQTVIPNNIMVPMRNNAKSTCEAILDTSKRASSLLFGGERRIYNAGLSIADFKNVIFPNMASFVCDRSHSYSTMLFFDNHFSAKLVRFTELFKPVIEYLKKPIPNESIDYSIFIGLPVDDFVKSTRYTGQMPFIGSANPCLHKWAIELQIKRHPLADILPLVEFMQEECAGISAFLFELLLTKLTFRLCTIISTFRVEKFVRNPKYQSDANWMWIEAKNKFLKALCTFGEVEDSGSLMRIDKMLLTVHQILH